MIAFISDRMSAARNIGLEDNTPVLVVTTIVERSLSSMKTRELCFLARQVTLAIHPDVISGSLPSWLSGYVH